ncbi:MAG: hypothetical protein ACNI25_06740 [Halarcobacter sp.]
MKELIYTNNLASAKIDSNRLKSQTKPYLSFDYNHLFYTTKEKFYILDGRKFLLTHLQMDEIDAYLNTLFTQKEKIEANQIIQSLESYLRNTDWMVIRQMETGKEIPPNIKLKREDTRKKINEIRKYL